MLSFLKLIRLPNLIIIAVTMLLVRYCLIMPAFIFEYNHTGTFPSYLSKTGYGLLILSTVLIAAAGYIINDVFDVNIDEVNKPGKNLIGKKYSAKLGRKLFYIFSGTGILFGLYLALVMQRPNLAFIQAFSAVSLYLYASHYKRRFFIGNFIVALLCGLSVAIGALFEPSIYPNIQFVLYFALFAFLVTLIREIIKDIEDLDGDELAQCKTIPIVLGVNRSKIIIYVLTGLTLTVLIYILWKFFHGSTVVNFGTLVGMFLIPFLALVYLVKTAKEKKDYYYAAVFAKGIMLYGILSMIPFWYYFLK